MFITTVLDFLLDMGFVHSEGGQRQIIWLEGKDRIGFEPILPSYVRVSSRLDDRSSKRYIVKIYSFIRLVLRRVHIRKQEPYILLLLRLVLCRILLLRRSSQRRSLENLRRRSR